MIGSLHECNSSGVMKWQLDLSNGQTLYAATKADVIYQALQLDNPIEKVFENYATRNPHTYLNQSKRFR